jgi:hypothetical protein
MYMYMYTHAIDKLPTLDQLLLFKYTYEGETKKLRIIDSASRKWKDIATLICGDVNILSDLEQRYRGDQKECLRQVFINHFISRKPRNYSQDWNGLIELLEDIKFGQIAEYVRHALSFESGGQHHEVSMS